MYNVNIYICIYIYTFYIPFFLVGFNLEGMSTKNNPEQVQNFSLHVPVNSVFLFFLGREELILRGQFPTEAFMSAQKCTKSLESTTSYYIPY